MLLKMRIVPDRIFDLAVQSSPPKYEFDAGKCNYSVFCSTVLLQMYEGNRIDKRTETKAKGQSQAEIRSLRRKLKITTPREWK
jgi:hypothetical protein